MFNVITEFSSNLAAFGVIGLLLTVLSIVVYRRQAGRGRSRPRPIVVAGLVLLSLPALAHDMWLIPPQTAKVGKPVEIAIPVGMDFPKSLSAIKPERLTIKVDGPKGQSAEVKTRIDYEAKTTFASFTPKTKGVWMMSATTAPNLIEMKAEKFNSYLIHDGLAHVLAKRMEQGAQNTDAVERYSKYVKTIVPVESDGGDGVSQAVVGHIIEIVPLTDPLAAKVGETLEVRVLYQGKPLAHANLCWDHPGNGEDFNGQTWTDGRGQALVPISRTGLMTLRLIHMTQPKKADYEWESFWASYTFRVK